MNNYNGDRMNTQAKDELFSRLQFDRPMDYCDESFVGHETKGNFSDYFEDLPTKTDYNMSNLFSRFENEIKSESSNDTGIDDRLGNLGQEYKTVEDSPVIYNRESQYNTDAIYNEITYGDSRGEQSNSSERVNLNKSRLEREKLESERLEEEIYGYEKFNFGTGMFPMLTGIVDRSPALFFIGLVLTFILGLPLKFIICALVGESVIKSSYNEAGKSMKLYREHMDHWNSIGRVAFVTVVSLFISLAVLIAAIMFNIH